MKSRQQVIELLKPFLAANPKIIAVWEAGSAATGFLDAFSDLDISVICNDDAVEEVFKDLTLFLSSTFGIISSYRVPEPTWHGFSQTFYQIDQVEPLFYLDVGVIKASLPKKFMETDRHGHAIVWFEKQPMYFPGPTPQDETNQRVTTTVMNALKLEFLFTYELKKALARENVIDIHSQLMTYLGRVAAPLFNATYRPSKVDFGLRYASRDYPKSLVSLIESLMTSSDITLTKQKVNELFQEVQSHKENLSKQKG